jgi:hypothetical protein
MRIPWENTPNGAVAIIEGVGTFVIAKGKTWWGPVTLVIITTAGLRHEEGIIEHDHGFPRSKRRARKILNEFIRKGLVNVPTDLNKKRGG